MEFHGTVRYRKVMESTARVKAESGSARRVEEFQI